jgi:hypothetical protein
VSTLVPLYVRTEPAHATQHVAESHLDATDADAMPPATNIPLEPQSPRPETPSNPPSLSASPVVTTTASEETPQRGNATGLRHRSTVPARPSALSPLRPSMNTATAATNTNHAPSFRRPHPSPHASLSRGLALSSNWRPPFAPPSLHHGLASSFQQSQVWEDRDPDATEFLSRLLLMLGSFVIFCLLLF